MSDTLYVLFSAADYYPAGGDNDTVSLLWGGTDEQALAWAEGQASPYGERRWLSAVDPGVAEWRVVRER